MAIDGRTRLIGLIGHPVEHSLSPLIHNTALSEQAVNARYVAFDVAPERVREAVMGMIALGFLGSNVTIPHKQAVRALADSLSEQARAVGAVNTLVFVPGEQGTAIYGDNTDVAGFLQPLQAHLPELTGREVTILGAGGAARAVVYALLTALRPSRLSIVARDLQKAGQLASELAAYDRNGALSVLPFEQARPAVSSSALVVNTTPVGMYPQVEGSPWAHHSAFSQGQIVYDLIYNPLETRLLHEARAAGAHTIGGLEMLVGQAAASYVQWIGEEMPLHAVRRALAGFLMEI